VRVLVTGAAGQLGVELLRTAPSRIDVVGLGHGECDIIDPTQVDAAAEIHQPNLIINAAAYTAVDAAESAENLAYAVNATGAGNVARAAQSVGARVIHVSSDYVFDGRSHEPYGPDSQPNPVSVYGASKLAGETAVRLASPNALVLRSSWLYASHGKNFLNTILSGIRASKPLRVVNDQIGVPTSARSLAQAIWACAERPELSGVQHWVDGGTGSWYDFAVAIQKIALEQRLVERPTAIAPVTSAEYQLPARRPAYSVLDARTLSRAISRELRHWRTWLEETMGELA
jgi:dTDP-4-dehydrorhamnose reductase